MQRKLDLSRLLGKAAPGAAVHRMDDGSELDGPTVFAHVCKPRLEGIVSKRRDSRYRSGRSKDWLESKNPDCEAVRRESEEDWSRQRQ
jgi:bifunctional non-homologous end joining protein LigD